MTSPQRTIGDRDLARIQGALAAVLDGRTADRVERAGGGLVNESFFVRAGGRELVLRLTAETSRALIGLEDELRVLDAVARAGLGPAPVGIDPGRDALVVERVLGAEPWTERTVHEPEAMHRLTAALRSLHALEVPIPPYSPERYAASYLATLGGRAALGPVERALADEALALAARYRERFDGPTLCHNDLTGANVLDDGDRLLLVDFEYAAASSPILDLASVVVMNDLDAESAGALLGAYFERGRVPFSRAEFAKVLRMVRLLGHFWARAEQAGDTDRKALSKFLDRAD